jgi:hypothetical protein
MPTLAESSLPRPFAAGAGKEHRFSVIVHLLEAAPKWNSGLET